MRHLAVLLVCSLVTMTAAADAIPEQPPCPTGARRVISGHEVIYCDPTSCAADADCESGETCQSLGLCIDDVSRRVSTTFPAEPGDPGRDVSYRDARASCEAGAACPSGSCAVARRCGPRAATPSSPPPASPPVQSETSSGGCAVSGRSSSSPFGWFLALAVAARISASLRPVAARARAAPSAR